MARGKQIILAALVCGGMVLVPTSAQAAPSTAIAAGSAGSVDVLGPNGQTASAPPIAPCATGGTAQNSSLGVTAGVTKFGRTTTTCTSNANGTATAVANGQRFETTVLTQFGGPTIKVRTFSARCDTTANGSSGYIELGGVTGVTVPQNITANYTVHIPGSGAGAPPIADVIMNEIVVPSPPDGSLTTYAMHIKLFPQGNGPASGDIILGSASCDPYGG